MQPMPTLSLLTRSWKGANFPVPRQVILNSAKEPTSPILRIAKEWSCSASSQSTTESYSTERRSSLTPCFAIPFAKNQ